MYYCSSYSEDYAFIKDIKKEEISFKSSRLIINIQWKFHWFHLDILQKNKMRYFFICVLLKFIYLEEYIL